MRQLHNFRSLHHPLLVLASFALFISWIDNAYSVQGKPAQDDRRQVSSRSRQRDLSNATQSNPTSSGTTELDITITSLNDTTTTTTSAEDSQEAETDSTENDTKYTSSPGDITLEDIDFVNLRLQHILKRTFNSSLKSILRLQRREFLQNPIYKEGWTIATREYHSSRKENILEGFPTKQNNDSLFNSIPIEYHIALIAYTLQEPEPLALYADFNRKTREVCSGKDVDSYRYKSYFRLLSLAVQTLSTIGSFRGDGRNTKFFYRGVGSTFALEEGQLLAFQHFISTSRDLPVAEEFADSTLFEFKGRYEGTGVYVGHHSEFAEEEVLFSPLQVFQVESKHVGKYYTRYVLVAKNNKKDEDDENKGRNDCHLRTGEEGMSQLTVVRGSGTRFELPVVSILVALMSLYSYSSFVFRLMD